MKTSRLARVLVLVLLFTPALLAAEDLTGKWGGTFIVTTDGQSHDDTAHFVVTKQTGAELTGTIGPNPDEQWPIIKGKIEAVKENGKDVTKVTFDVQVGGDTSGPIAHFDLALVEGHLKGSAKASQDGHEMAATLDLTKLK